MKERNCRSDAPEAIVLERKTKIKKHLGVSAIAATAFFLIFPDLAIFDFFPDFIGYVILLIGISQLRDLNDYFGDAYDRFYKIAWIAAARFLSFFIVLGLVTPQERPDTMLLLAFVFGVADFVLVIPAWRDLFEGFSYLNARCDGVTFDLVERAPKRAYRTNRRKGIRKGDLISRKPLSLTECARKITFFFIGAKAILNVLPEFAALTADTEISLSFRLYDYIMFLRLGAMIASLVIGIVFFIRIVRFVRSVKRDEVFLGFYKEKYRTDVLTKEHLFIHRHLKNALLVASIAMIFRVDFRIDRMHLLPDAIMALLLILTVMILGKHVGNKRGFTVFSAIYAVLSLSVNLYEAYFHYTYSVTSIQTNVAANRAYTVLCSVKVLEQVVFLAVFAMFLLLMQNVIRSYTGFSVSGRDTLIPSEKIRSIHESLTKQLRIVFVLAVVTAVSKCLVTFLALAGRPGLEMDFLPLVDALISAIFAFFAIRTVREIYSQVEYRFMLL